MSNTYLPADVRTRIVDLMKANKATQKKPALALDNVWLELPWWY